MTAARNSSPKWIKRAVIGSVVALMAGGGITVAANAAPGDTHTRTARGLTEEEALEVGKRLCERSGFAYGGPVGEAVLIPGSLIGEGRADEYEVTVKCIEK
jgi:hypothetical protein